MRERTGKILNAIQRDARILQRFWSCVDKDEAENGCWEWRGRCSQPGYPSFQVGQDTIPPAFVTWFVTTGEMPSGGRLHRLCENSRCVRSSHLAWILGRAMERRLLAEADGYVALPGVPWSLDDPSPRLPRVVRLASSV
jgi:hypothetical protein